MCGSCAKERSPLRPSRTRSAEHRLVVAADTRVAFEQLLASPPGRIPCVTRQPGAVGATCLYSCVVGDGQETNAWRGTCLIRLLDNRSSFHLPGWGDRSS